MKYTPINKLTLIEEWIIRTTITTMNEDGYIDVIQETEIEDILRVMKAKLHQLRTGRIELKWK